MASPTWSRGPPCGGSPNASAMTAAARITTPLIVIPGQASCASPRRGGQRITRAVIARGRIEGQAGRDRAGSSAGAVARSGWSGSPRPVDRAWSRAEPYQRQTPAEESQHEFHPVRNEEAPAQVDGQDGHEHVDREQGGDDAGPRAEEERDTAQELEGDQPGGRDHR